MGEKNIMKSAKKFLFLFYTVQREDAHEDKATIKS